MHGFNCSIALCYVEIALYNIRLRRLDVPSKGGRTRKGEITLGLDVFQRNLLDGEFAGKIVLQTETDV